MYTRCYVYITNLRWLHTVLKMIWNVVCLKEGTVETRNVTIIILYISKFSQEKKKYMFKAGVWPIPLSSFIDLFFKKALQAVIDDHLLTTTEL